MAKGNALRIDPFYPDGQQDFLNMPSTSKFPLGCSVASSASTPSTIFPYLRRLDIREDRSSRQQKNPLLTLKLSSSSFLDSKVHDGLSDNPLYTIETGSTSTSVLRYDPWEGHTKVADIRWPERMPIRGKGKESLQGVAVEMNGSRTKAVEQFLKHGTLSGSRKFVIPDYPHPFKWRRSGSSYHCTTVSVKGPVATLDGAEPSVPPRIRVFEPLLIQDTRPQLDRGGVSLSLLDHLLITALLLVTDAEEWVTLARPGSADRQAQSAPASVRQWRKIVYGEPLFPSLRSPADKSARTSQALDDNLRPSSPANRPVSMRQMRKIVFGEPLFPSRTQTDPGGLAFASQSSISMDDLATGSSESESMNYPSTPVSTSAPTLGHLDPAFSKALPEVPLQLRSNSRSPPLLQLSTDISVLPTSSSFAHRDLPQLPIPSSSSANHNQPPLQRSRSTPYFQYSETAKRSSSSQSTYAFVDYACVDSPIFMSGGSRRRKLPQLPQTTDTTITPYLTKSTIPIRLRNEKSRPRSHTQRSLPDPPNTSAIGSSSESAQEQYMQQSMEKQANELEDEAWVRSLTPEQQRNLHRTVTVSHNTAFDAPPPAYNAIDFSYPPHDSFESPPPPPSPC
ncbi:hypothetical protein PILCRDRAFT_819446 [Piloderma croceum F 1598]|uniref:Uncharacterized protein n=1 Tax=Piloderma croceum (strain F 1598) TaxID=765440 RepID=A0A0C3FFG1_PILCF|nr:hypothetical protein PILCRDRAFT_819446 [Piloderma croceum F 1598]